MYYFHFHKYSEWKTIHEFTSTKYGIVKIIQQRTCSVCGYKQVSSQEVG